VKFTFLCFGIKASLTEMLKYFLNMPVIFEHVINLWKAAGAFVRLKGITDHLNDP